MAGTLRNLALVVVAAFTLTGLSACGHSGSSGSSSNGTASVGTGDITFSPAPATVFTTIAGPLPPNTLPFSQTFTVVSGGAPPFTFTPVTVPPGLALAATAVQPGLTGTLSATLSGTAAQPGLENFTMTVTDAVQHSVTATWYVEVGPAVPALQVTPATMPNGTRGQPYSVFLQATNGTTPFSWSVTTGPLPPGLNFTPSTGVTFQLSGTPTTAGTFPFTVTVSDGSTPTRSAVLSLSVTVP